MNAQILQFPRKRTVDDIMFDMESLSYDFALSGLEMVNKKLELLRELQELEGDL